MKKWIQFTALYPASSVVSADLTSLQYYLALQFTIRNFPLEPQNWSVISQVIETLSTELDKNGVIGAYFKAHNVEEAVA